MPAKRTPVIETPEGPAKRCPDCGGVFLMTLEYWYAHNRHWDGLRNYCKTCTKLRALSDAAKNPEKQKARKARYRSENVDKVKQAEAKYRAEHADQRRIYSARYQSEHSNELNAKARIYRAINSDKVRRWERTAYAKHSEKIKAYQKEYNKTHSEKVRARQRRYNAEHKEQHNASTARWHLEHPAEVKGARKRWKINHPGEVRAASRRRRAMARILPFSWTAADESRALDRWNNRCAYCDHPLPQLKLFDASGTHFDHYIPLADPRRPHPGTIPQNMLPACATCNMNKSDSDPVEWIMRKFGQRKGKQIIARIQAYFDSLASTSD